MRSFFKLSFLVFVGLSVLFIFSFIPDFVSPLSADCPTNCYCPGPPSTCSKYGSDCFTYSGDRCYCMGEFGTASCGTCICEGGGPCFTGETEVATEPGGGAKKIKELKPGDMVESFDPETGEIKENTISKVTKTTSEGYYLLETESGQKVRVTGEHPFLAVKAKGVGSQTVNGQLIEGLRNAFSQTLAYRVITTLKMKIGETLK